MKFTSKYAGYFLLALLLYMPIFGHLDTLPIRIWDEARNAVNAYEMLNGGDYIVTHYLGAPDMWNTKPPLLIWLQAFSMNVLGVNELAVRLPSAIAGVFTCIVLLIFSLRYLKSFWFGFIAVLVLITSQGYIGIHAVRTGDYDALLTLFTTLSGLLFFAFCETKKSKFIYLFFLATTLAVLTKSITGLLFLPALCIYSIIQKEFIPLLKNKHFYIGLFSLVSIVLGYYLLREAQNPGYIHAVWENELGGRYGSVIENHKEEFLFYYHSLIYTQFTVWHLLIPCGFVTGFVVKNKKVNRLTLFSFIMIVTYFLIVSSAQTKLAWYTVPLFPFLTIGITIFIYFLFDLFRRSEQLNRVLRVNVTPFIFLFLIGIGPYRQILDKTYKPVEHGAAIALYEIGYYLQDAVEGKYNLDNKYLLYEGYRAQNLFYLNILNDKGVQISFKDWKKLVPNDIVIAYQEPIKDYLAQHYDTEILQIVGNVVTYKIHGEKD